MDNVLSQRSWDGQMLFHALALSSLFAAGVGIFLYVTCVAVRAHFRSLSAVQEQLRTFSFNDTFCHCCSTNHVDPKAGKRVVCDRKAMALCLELWFGSVADFDALVQDKVAEAFENRVTRYVLPYLWLTGATIPLFWYAIHFCFRFGDWLAFVNFYYAFGWWLGVLTLFASLWLRIARRLHRQRNRRWKEILLNIACSCLAALMFFLFVVLSRELLG